MAKYSTGGVGSEDADSCELCGADDRSLRETTVAGATLQVCGECVQHGDDDSSGDDGDRSDEQERRREAARNTARLADATSPDATRWEEGTDYEDDPLPYLVSGYGDRMAEARQEAGLQAAELAGELGVTEADIVAIEQGRANRANIPGSLIEAIEERLNVQLSED
ncbi:multiprotein-bridging factor 1 family protein [Halosegnis sp.]|uniref:helix-turn-helix domain-containing protein n=1 Tax=Halosegnis sp. TaxID=2864959 RepID=UPI0035D4FB63